MVDCYCLMKMIVNNDYSLTNVITPQKCKRMQLSTQYGHMTLRVPKI